MNSIDFSNIRLIIWDMDGTFYSGNLMEGTAFLENRMKKIILALINLGIQNSICSKNDYDNVRLFLEQNGLWNYFVFPKINYESKATNIAEIVKSSRLHSRHILFIDDNEHNLNEIHYYDSEINVSGPEIIQEIDRFISKTKAIDKTHKKLMDYKLIEKKINAKKGFDSNEQFLQDSKIKVEFHYDCNIYLDRLYELGVKSNQLNFTKRRLSKIELQKSIENNEFQTAYITVSDIYGDYGVVGYYCLFGNVLLDFYFSCRILGMGVEQYVYSKLGCPKINISGTASVNLKCNYCPSWISSRYEMITSNRTQKNMYSILLRGECDMKQVINYLKSSTIDGEFDRDSTNGHIYNMHTSLLAQRIEHSDEYCKQIIENNFFFDRESLNFKMLSKHYDVIVMALSSDVRQGLYSDRKSGAIIAVGDNTMPINSNTSLNVLNQKSRINFDIETLKEFEKRYEYIGSANFNIIKNNLLIIRKKVSPDTLLILMKYPLMFYEEMYNEKTVNISACNAAVDAVCRIYPQNTYALDLNKVVSSPDDIADDLLHYKRIIYYYIAKEIAHIIEKRKNLKINMPTYTLPYIPKEIQKDIYKLYDTTDFIIIGLEKESILLALALRKKCRYIVDISKRYSGESSGIKVVSPKEYIADEQESSVLIHKSILESDAFIKIKSEKLSNVTKNMFVFP